MAEEKKDFIVKDRRFIAEERSKAEEKETKTAPQNGVAQEAGRNAAQCPESAEEKPKASPQKPQKSEAAEQIHLPEINFPTFIFSLNSSALVQLGLIDDPATGKNEKNLTLAKQTIDILGMLEEKTRGNLSSDEANMLKSILYDLRMIYVKERK